MFTTLLSYSNIEDAYWRARDFISKNIKTYKGIDGFYSFPVINLILYLICFRTLLPPFLKSFFLFEKLKKMDQIIWHLIFFSFYSFVTRTVSKSCSVTSDMILTFTKKFVLKIRPIFNNADKFLLLHACSVFIVIIFIVLIFFRFLYFWYKNFI